jgi:hypothetical protein
MADNAYSYSNREAAVKQRVRETFLSYFENNVPTWDALGRHTPKAGDISPKGVSIPLETSRPGGFKFYTPDDADFNEYTPPETSRMYVYPLMAALGILMQGTTQRSFKRDGENSLQSEDQWMARHVEAFMKRFNYMCHGDGSGRLAVSASTLAAAGPGQTLNCTTTAATTPGQTKGAKRLELNHTYQAWNPSTGALRGTFKVTTPGTSSCTINITSGSITSGDDITDVGSYNRAFRGLPHLIDNTSRILQTRNTATDTDLNDPVIDLNGAALSPITFTNLETLLGIRNNDVMPEGGIRAVAIMTPGAWETLRIQQYGFRMNVNEGQSTARGVARRFVVDGIDFVLDADGEEDRGFLIKNGEKMPLAWYEEKEFGPYDVGDGGDGSSAWRMLFGANQTGSDNWQKAIGWGGALCKVMTRSAAAWKRAALGSTQVTAG